ncbi:MAG: acetate--CoA ligase family protein [Nitrospirota bacterium]|nr:acetate--CoA ligase family protein [Nitrospirota bacterium]
MNLTDSDIDFFFAPRSIAIVGASPEPGKLSRIILDSLRRMGFPGKIYPVNPRYTEIDGIPCFPSLKEIKGEVDVAVIAIPAAAVLSVLDDAAGKVRGAIIISAGFGEIGEKGRQLEAEVRKKAAGHGIRLMGPNCMGLYDTASCVDTFFITSDKVGRPAKGGLSILSQSGSIAAVIMDDLARQGIGVARLVSYGNRIDVGEVECLEFLADDPHTTAVALYIESVDDGRRFIEAASRCAAKKPVIALKIGKGEAAVRAARSHTGAMAGRYEVYRAAFKKAGIIEAEGFEELRDACQALSFYKPVSGQKVFIVTGGGGVGVGLSDACESMGLDVSPLPREAGDKIAANVAGFYTVANPLDLTGSAADREYALAMEEGLKAGYDIIIMTVLWGPPRITPDILNRLKEIRDRYDRPVLICSPGGSFSRGLDRAWREKGFPVFETPEAAARAAAVLTNGR